MRYTVACDSDIGRVRTVNQDAIFTKHIATNGNEVVFAVLCDGMGGFEEGEIASATVVNTFAKWFENSSFFDVVDYSYESVKKEWFEIIDEVNCRIYRYGQRKKINIGSTVTVLMIINNQYYILNVGDGRVYELTKDIVQLTKDHSVVAQKVEQGVLTKEQAMVDPRRNQLLKSIGGLRDVVPDFFSGLVPKEAVYMMCCDGVRNKVYDDELLYYFHPNIMTDSDNMRHNIRYIFELNKARKESDNMSIILIKNNSTTIVYDDRNVVYDEQFMGSNNKIIYGDRV